MLLIIFAWIFLFLIVVSIGGGSLKLITRLTSHPHQYEFGIFYNFWFGFALLTGILQLLSLFLPLGNTVFIIICLIALLLAGVQFKRLKYKLKVLYGWLITFKGLMAFLGIGIIVLFAAYSANREVTHTDTFLYHYNAVKWAKDYPVVPGLVNLHGRLGFNSSFFLFAAFTEVGMYANHSVHIALSFLMIVCLIHWSFIIGSSREVMGKRIFCMMTYPFLLIHISSKMDIASLSTDYPMAIVTLVFCSVLLDRIKNKIVLLLPLAATVFTIKLSGMLTIGVALALYVGYLFFMKQANQSLIERKVHKRVAITSFAILCFIVSGFIIRNVIISGWLIYPFPLGNLHLPWSTPRQYVIDMIDVIKSFPKIPGGATPITIKEHSFFFWFTQWYNQFRLSMEFNMIVGSLIILFWSLWQVRFISRFIYAHLNLMAVVVLSFASILFWFISAPDLRFGSIYFFMFLASVIVLFYQGSTNKNIVRFLIYGFFIYQIVVQVPVFVLDREPNLFTFAYTKQPSLTKVIASPPEENPPLYIYMPVSGNQCGNSALPCTPYAGGLLHIHQLVRQRVPGDISKGFLPAE